MDDGTSKSEKSNRKLGPAITVLRVIDSAAEAFPPLKSVTGAALNIVQTVEKYHANQEEWIQFAHYAARLTTCVVEQVSASSIGLETIETALGDLESTLNEIQAEIERITSLTTLKKIQRFVQDPGHIKELRQQLDDAVSVFQTACGLSAASNFATLASKIDEDDSITASAIEELSKKLSLKLKLIPSNVELVSLPFADNSSWSSSSTCLSGTRTTPIRTIMNWIEGDSTTASLYVLSGAAGSGKSAIAHTIAKLCSGNGTLLATFFFDAKALWRRDCSCLYTTIARDLCTFSEKLAHVIRLTTHSEPNLASASAGIQFAKLIHHPLHLHPPLTRGVIILDALDEGYNDELLDILRDRVPTLPPGVRVLVTTRPDYNILPPLIADNPAHITVQSFDLLGSSNQDDIKLYLRSRLARIAQVRRIQQWPQEHHLEQLEETSGGLFIWASTACESLQHAPDAQAALEVLLSPSAKPLPPMDALYTKIIEKCDWESERFRVGYQAYLGAVLNLKIPLTIQALQPLLAVRHEGLSIRPLEILTPLQPVLSDLTNGEPVQTVHLSFTEFMAHNSHLFSLDLVASHEQLAVRCLTMMSTAFSGGAVRYGAGYLVPPNPPTPDSHHTFFEIPSPSQCPLSEELSYAVQHWTHHLSAVSNPLPSSVHQALHKFLKANLVHWIEVSAVHGHCQPLAPLRAWLQKEDHDHPFLKYIIHPDVASTLHRLSNALVAPNRRQEALEAVEEALYIRRTLAKRLPSPHTRHDLASTLNRLAVRQLAVSVRDPARLAAQESCTIFQSLSPSDHLFLPVDIANSLHTYTWTLFDIRSYDEAFLAVSESIRLNKEIRDRTPSTDDDLAVFLETLAHGLSLNGQYQDAYAVDQERLTLRRELLVKDPSSPHQLEGLANCLIALSGHLTGIFRREEALELCEEAYKVIERLSVIWPKKTEVIWVAYYAQLTNTLSRLDRDEECLAAAEKSIKWLRSLVKADPVSYYDSLGHALTQTTSPLIVLKRPKDAVMASQEAVKIFKMLADSLTMHEPSLVTALSNHCNALMADNQCDEAIACASEAKALAKRLLDENFAAATAESYGLVLTLHALCFQKLSPSRDVELLAACVECVDWHTVVLEHGWLLEGTIGLAVTDFAGIMCEMGSISAAGVFGERVLKYKSSTNALPGDPLVLRATELTERCRVMRSKSES